MEETTATTRGMHPNEYHPLPVVSWCFVTTDGFAAGTLPRWLSAIGGIGTALFHDCHSCLASSGLRQLRQDAGLCHDITQFPAACSPLTSPWALKSPNEEVGGSEAVSLPLQVRAHGGSLCLRPSGPRPPSCGRAKHRKFFLCFVVFRLTCFDLAL